MAIFNVGERRVTLSEKTTDGRYVKIEPNVWWDTTTVELLTDEEIEKYLDANPGVGIMCETVALDS